MYRCGRLTVSSEGHAVCTLANSLLDGQTIPSGAKVIKIDNIDPDTGENLPMPLKVCTAHTILLNLTWNRDGVNCDSKT